MSGPNDPSPSMPNMAIRITSGPRETPTGRPKRGRSGSPTVAPPTYRSIQAANPARSPPTSRSRGEPPEDEPYSNSDIDTRKVTVTFFQDETGQQMRRVDMTLPQLAEHIRYQTAASKMELPWLKLAIFGNKRSEKNCLRTNENVLQITGIEVEHDRAR